MPVNTTNAREKSIATAIDEIGSGKPLSDSTRRLLLDTFRRSDKVLNDDGSVKAAANVSGRTEQLQTTLANVTAAGKLNSLGNVVDTSTDHLTDGTGSPLTGGKRAANALDSNNRLANSFRATPVNVSNTPTASTNLSNDGISTAIPVTAYTSQFPPGAVSYNSGSVDPGTFGSSIVYFDDATFAGGAVAFQFANTPQAQTAAEGRCIVGQITTVNGSAKTGGGNTGGTGGKTGGRGFING